MSATSVTGRGPGASNGKQKPGNNCGCSCGQSQETTPSSPSIPRGCVVSYKTGGSVSIRVGGRIRTTVCG